VGGKAGDHAHGGGLAGAVRPEEAEHLAALDDERHVIDGAARFLALDNRRQ
jgi:hypothetical protein